MKTALFVALILAPLPAAADPLQALEPLLEVFSADHASPGWDVAGIRCAGLLYAQDSWRQDHGSSGPSKKLMDSAATGLAQATEHRIGTGQSRTTATLSVETDFRRVHALYLARFAVNDADGHPWRDDALLKGDQSYCQAALG